MNIVQSVTAAWRKLPTALRSAWITAWVVFTGSIITIGTGLLPVLANAISTRNFDPFYDSLNLAANTAISAALAFVSGVVNGVYRWLRPIEQSYKQIPPAR